MLYVGLFLLGFGLCGFVCGFLQERRTAELEREKIDLQKAFKSTESILREKLKDFKPLPYLEITAGPWGEKTREIPLPQNNDLAVIEKWSKEWSKKC